MHEDKNNTATFILAAITSHYRTFATPPTLRWIADEVGVSSLNTIKHHLRVLVNEGTIVMSGPEGSDKKPVPKELFDEITY